MCWEDKELQELSTCSLWGVQRSEDGCWFQTELFILKVCELNTFPSTSQYTKNHTALHAALWL